MKAQLARKYRPNSLKEIIGQRPVVEALTRALAEDAVSPVYIFSGSRGVGKTTAARVIAKVLNCSKPKSKTEACGECASCQEIGVSRSFDVMEFDAASNTGVEDIRRVITDGIYIQTARDPYKIYIVDEVHMLSKAAFNALLKTLEEAPDKVIFIMATTEVQKIPDTVMSRAQHFVFGDISKAEIRNHLEKVCKLEGFEFDNAGLDIIASVATGSMRDGLMRLQQVAASGKVSAKSTSDILSVADPEALAQLIRDITSSKAAETFNRVHTMLSEGKTPETLIKDLLAACHDILAALVGADEKVYLSILNEETVKELSCKLEYQSVLRVADLLGKGEEHLRYSDVPKLRFELLLLQIINELQ